VGRRSVWIRRLWLTRLAGLPPGRQGEGRRATLLACHSCSSGGRSIRAARYDAGRCNASLGLGGRVALAYPEWASLPVGVLSLLHACPKFRVPTSVGGDLHCLF
jgi:hypothetical protein